MAVETYIGLNIREQCAAGEISGEIKIFDKPEEPMYLQGAMSIISLSYHRGGHAIFPDKDPKYAEFERRIKGTLHIRGGNIESDDNGRLKPCKDLDIFVDAAHKLLDKAIERANK
ncbi:hypothetical protein KY337_02705 [Candidatus Woesearchaeota archaeon]|nr:hypothetical protein [Candidatus Woesearchaeota archaeon]